MAAGGGLGSGVVAAVRQVPEAEPGETMARNCASIYRAVEAAIEGVFRTYDPPYTARCCDPVRACPRVQHAASARRAAPALRTRDRIRGPCDFGHAKTPRRVQRGWLCFWLRGHATNDTCDWSSRKFPSSPLSLTHSALSGNRCFKSLKLRGSPWPDNDPPSDSFQWHRRACFLCSDGYVRSYQVFDLSGYRRDQVNINIRRLDASNQCVARLALGSSKGFTLAPPA